MKYQANWCNMYVLTWTAHAEAICRTYLFFFTFKWHKWKLESLSKWKICIWKTGKIINTANMRSVHNLWIQFANFDRPKSLCEFNFVVLFRAIVSHGGGKKRRISRKWLGYANFFLEILYRFLKSIFRLQFFFSPWFLLGLFFCSLE